MSAFKYLFSGSYDSIFDDEDEGEGEGEGCEDCDDGEE